MAKKQTRRSVSLSRATYERLKAFCEVNEVSMSEFVESRIGDYLGRPRSPARNGGQTLAPDADDGGRRVGGIFTF